MRCWGKAPVPCSSAPSGSSVFLTAHPHQALFGVEGVLLRSRETGRHRDSSVPSAHHLPDLPDVGACELTGDHRCPPRGGAKMMLTPEGFTWDRGVGGFPFWAVW